MNIRPLSEMQIKCPTTKESLPCYPKDPKLGGELEREVDRLQGSDFQQERAVVSIIVLKRSISKHEYKELEMGHCE